MTITIVENSLLAANRYYISLLRKLYEFTKNKMIIIYK